MGAVRKIDTTPKWQDVFLFKVYAMVMDGRNQEDIIRELDISDDLWYRWKRERPLLRLAYTTAQQDRSKKTVDFGEYCVTKLSKEARAIWDKLKEIDKTDDTDVETKHEKISRIMTGINIKLRQQIFFQAYVSRRFNVSRAMDLAGVDAREYGEWKSNDPNFLLLFDEMTRRKKDFFEQQLVALTEMGSEQAILFVNRTVNRDRGYNDKIDVNVTGAISHEHRHMMEINFETLELPIETLRQVHVAIKKQQETILEADSVSKRQETTQERIG